MVNANQTKGETTVHFTNESIMINPDPASLGTLVVLSESLFFSFVENKLIFYFEIVFFIEVSEYKEI